jgi:transposase-like protein
MMHADREGNLHVTETEAAPRSFADERHRVNPQRPGKALRSRLPLFGLSAAHGRLAVEVIPDDEVEQLECIQRTRKARESIAVHALRRYAAVVSRGRLHRLALSSGGHAPFGQIEAFWAYLQRQLRAKGGIRRERLGLYLAEFAWRYNRRKVSPEAQVRELLTMLRQPNKWDK